MKSQQWPATVWVVFFTGVSLGVGTGVSEGFRNPTPGTFGLGRSGGRFAQVDDASAVLHNPANLMDIEAAELQFVPSIVYYRAEFTSAAGSDRSESPWHVLPNLFASVPVVTNSMVFGLGVTLPYGLATEWEQPLTSPLRYNAPYETDLVTLNINPTVAVTLAPGLTLGGGLDVMWSQLELGQWYPWMVFPGSTGSEPDGDLRFKGDGVGFGGNVGLTWEFLSGHRMAATYRSSISVDYDGDTKISNVTPTALFLGATPSSTFGTRVSFPTIVGLGYGVRLSDRVRVEISGEWLEFSKFDSLRVSAGNNGFLLPASEIVQDWENTFTVGIGGDWRFADAWTLRAGYQYFETPVPDETMSPSIPDANQHVVTVGCAWRSGAHSLEAAYGYDWYDRREITNNQIAAFNGVYEITVHMLSVAYRLRL